MSQGSGEEEDGEIVDTTGTITEEEIGTKDRIRTEGEDITEGTDNRISPTDQLDELVKDGEEMIGTRTRTRTRTRFLQLVTIETTISENDFLGEGIRKK